MELLKVVNKFNVFFGPAYLLLVIFSRYIMKFCLFIFHRFILQDSTNICTVVILILESVPLDKGLRWLLLFFLSFFHLRVGCKFFTKLFRETIETG